MRLLQTVLVVLGIASAAAAADGGATPPPPSPPAAASGPTVLDAVTQRRAEKVADDYLAQQQALHVPLDPQALLDLANAEVLLLEAKTYLDQKQLVKAGSDYLAASDKLHAIAADQRPLLGARLRQAQEHLTTLSLALLKTEAIDAGAHAPSTAPPAAQAPATPAVQPPVAPAPLAPPEAPAAAPAPSTPTSAPPSAPAPPTPAAATPVPLPAPVDK